MRNPLIDITSLNAVQSLFQGSIRDPWAEKLAGILADIFVYSDAVRYALPVPAGSYRSSGPLKEPSLLVQLGSRDSDALRAVEYSTKEPHLVREEHLKECLRYF